MTKGGYIDGWIEAIEVRTQTMRLSPRAPPHRPSTVDDLQQEKIASLHRSCRSGADNRPNSRRPVPEIQM